jgi:elongation factor 1-beta
VHCCFQAGLTGYHRYSPTQADVASYKAIKEPPPAKYPHVYRWYQHIASYESEFSSLPGDPSKAITAYGPETNELTINPAKAPAAKEEDDDDIDLFGSDEEEEEDPEAVRIREERLAEYRKKKESKAKPAAKSIVTLDVKPWGEFHVLWGSAGRLEILTLCFRR